MQVGRPWPVALVTELTVLQSCSIQSTLPDLSGALMLRSLLLADNAISGTTPNSLLNNLTAHTVTLSSNPISGTLSGPVLMKSLLLNDMALSGSLPSFSRPGLNSTLAVLSLARNYLTGSTDALEQESSLETIILSAVSVLLLACLSLCVGSLQNYFSCEVAGLDEATGLGQGVFQDPTTEALQSAGRASLQQTGITRLHLSKIAITPTQRFHSLATPRQAHTCCTF